MIKVSQKDQPQCMFENKISTGDIENLAIEIYIFCTTGDVRQTTTLCKTKCSIKIHELSLDNTNTFHMGSIDILIEVNESKHFEQIF